MTPHEPRLVTFDVMSDDPDFYFVLTTALRDFAGRVEADPDYAPDLTRRWVNAAEVALQRIEDALSRQPGSRLGYLVVTHNQTLGWPELDFAALLHTTIEEARADRDTRRDTATAHTPDDRWVIAELTELPEDRS